MLPNPNYSQVGQEDGLLTVSRKVVKHVIHRIAMGTPGVLQLGGDSIWKRLFKWLGLSMGPRGIELELADGEAAMTLTLVARLGIRVPELASELRRRVKRGLKEQLGIDVRTVNVHVVSLKAGPGRTPTDVAEEAPAGPLGMDAAPPEGRPRRFDLS